MGNINSRLQEIVDKLFNRNSRAFAQAVGVPPTSVANYLNPNVASKPTAEKLEAIVRKIGINGTWLLTGEGDMMKSTQTVHDISNSNVAGVNVSGTEIHIANPEAYNALLETVKTYQRITEKHQTQLDKAQQQIDELIALLKAKM